MSGAGTMKPLLEAEARERQRAAGRGPSHAGAGSRSFSSMEEKVLPKGKAQDLVGAKFGVSGKARGLIHVAELLARDPLVAVARRRAKAAR